MKALQHSLPFLPKQIKIISDNLGVVHDDNNIVFYNASGPIYMCAVNDKEGLRIAQGMFVDLKLARPKQIASALGVNTSTVHRNKKKYQDEGVKGFSKATPERTPYKLDDETCDEVQEHLDKNSSIRSAAKEVGLNEGTIRNGLKRGDLKKNDSENSVKSVSERSAEDQISENGIAVKRHCERSFARKGLIEEAMPDFEASEGVKYGGVLIALPVILSQGLLDIGEKIYKKLSDGFFGLQSILLTLTFMALLRIKNPEQLSKHSPGELGIILGLDRAPEVKTLRRKLEEIGNQEKAREFADLLARHWADKNPDVLGFLYIDGHVRPYNGSKNKLPKTHVTQKRLCMPATTDFWVNDVNAQPLFFITTEANDTLLSTIENEILPEIKELVEKDRRVTIVFDRAGWSPKTFKKWYDMGFDVMTYRKGDYEPWPVECFQEFEIKIGNKKIKYNLGQRSVDMELKNENFWMREVRRLCDNGHQTSILTTNQDIEELFVAIRMFSRWTQENFFRYMGIEFDFNHLCTYDVEAADPDRLVPNPVLKEKKKDLGKLRKEYQKNVKDLGDAAIKNNDKKQSEMSKFKAANAKKMQVIKELDIKCAELIELINDMPEKVPLKETMDEEKIVKLETERKTFTDLIKMIAYRAETSLFDFLVPPILARNEDEGRSFLKAVFQTPADIIPDEENKFLIIQFYTMANKRSNDALKSLCEIMNQEECIYPGTNLRLIFKAPELQTKIRPCQEP